MIFSNIRLLFPCWLQFVEGTATFTQNHKVLSYFRWRNTQGIAGLSGALRVGQSYISWDFRDMAQRILEPTDLYWFWWRRTWSWNAKSLNKMCCRTSMCFSNSEVSPAISHFFFCASRLQTAACVLAAVWGSAHRSHRRSARGNRLTMLNGCCLADMFTIFTISVQCFSMLTFSN